MTSSHAISAPPPATFHGRAVVRAAFIIASFGWGIGFYGPPVYLYAVVARTGWSTTLVAAAVTFHFLLGAAVVTRAPRWHARYGVAATTVAGAVALALGVVGWAYAARPWQLFTAAALSGGGWVLLGAVAINAMIAPWFVRERPRALARAYNGASLGGVIFAPLWSWLIARIGFAAAAGWLGACLVLVVGCLAWRVLATTPQALGQRPDGDGADRAAAEGLRPGACGAAHTPLPGRQLWRCARFRTLSLGMALGLFAQIGLLAHLYSHLAHRFDTAVAGLAMAMATACAVGGRTLATRWVRADTARRRQAACLSYAVQAVGAVLMLAGTHLGVPGVLAAGLALFGAGIGNATSLPPLIAQAEFAESDVSRVVALIVAISQGLYAFAPMAFAVAREIGSGSAAYFLAAAGIQVLACLCLRGAGAGRD